MDSVPQDWSFSLNLAGVQPVTSPKAPEPDTGYYRGVLEKAEMTVAKTGRPQVRVQVKLETGATRSTRFNVPDGSAQDKSLGFWVSLFLSVGYQSAQLTSGSIVINAETLPQLLVGRDCFTHYTAGDEATGTLGNLLLLPPDAWQAGVRANGAHVQAAGAAPGSALGGGQGGGIAGMGGGMGGTQGGMGGTQGGMGGGMGGGGIAGIGGGSTAAGGLGTLAGGRPANGAGQGAVGNPASILAGLVGGAR